MDLSFLTAPHTVLSQNMMWTLFGISVILLLALDLFGFNRKNEEPHFWHTFWVCIFYIVIAVLFGFFVMYEEGSEKGMLYFTGYLLEKSLSLDNIFVMSVIFSSIGVPSKYQHRVLFWGILGALVMRGVMIFLGEALVSRFHWVLYIFSIFLIYTGLHMLLQKEGEEKPFKETKVYKILSKFFHVTHEIHGEHFWVKENGKWHITPLLFALFVIETMDVIFAFDSIPAIFLVTQDVFIVYTSNIFAILGLRALYFLLAAIVNKFTYLKPALSIILIFIGLKIFAPHFGFEIQTWQSLMFTMVMLAGGIVLSLVKQRKNRV
ncbi:MAG: TerC family protein [Alphaproteobacteria bacterium]|nr:TerC family protein [Alphaproteobacteria bacterium]